MPTGMTTLSTLALPALAGSLEDRSEQAYGYRDSWLVWHFIPVRLELAMEDKGKMRPMCVRHPTAVM
jgi:hypothetical protein